MRAKVVDGQTVPVFGVPHVDLSNDYPKCRFENEVYIG